MHKTPKPTTSFHNLHFLLTFTCTYALPGIFLPASAILIAIRTLFCCRLPLLQAHCAVWAHTVVAVVYAPISTAQRFMCIDEVTSAGQLRQGNSWLALLGLGGGRCLHSGWSLARLRGRVREVQKRAQEAGGC